MGQTTCQESAPGRGTDGVSTVELGELHSIPCQTVDI